MKKIFVISFLVFISLIMKSQDTMSVMTYNLLNFGNYTSYCTSSNNNYDLKKEYLKTICHYVLPDILGVNEVDASNSVIQLILDSILNTNSTKTYSRISYINSSSSDIVSTIFYNNQKFKFYNTNFLQTDLRDVIILNLYYNGQEVELQHDTVFIRIMQAHLKAGSTAADQDQRAQETSVIMDYLNSLGNSKNTIVMGDFNVQSSTETSFQNLINYSNTNVRFYDPANKLGTWHDNVTYALYHSQAAQLSTNNCTAGGGLDDRFDFILTSFAIMNNLYKISYVPGSYKVIGQDGNHFNKSVNDNQNTSVPSTVLSALANMSDHLPVTLKLAVSQTPIIGFHDANFDDFKIVPVSWIGNELILNIQGEYSGKMDINIYDIFGRKLNSYSVVLANDKYYISIHTPTVSKGLYLMSCNYKGKTQNIKILHP